MLDLTNKVTVFVISVGRPSFNECIKHVKQQDCRFKLDIISKVAPLSTALQCMLDRCTTPYFIQVDEDMILNKDAVRLQYQYIVSSPDKVAIITTHLWDIHTERLIYGFKIYRHGIVKNYPFNNVQACEFDQIRRFKKDGYTDERVPIEEPLKKSIYTMGYHGPCWDPLSIYERYFSLTTKQRRHTADWPTTMAFWVKDYAEVFLNRFMETGSEIDLYALMGMVAGMLSSVESHGYEKDYRNYKKIQGFKEVNNFIQSQDKTKKTKQ